MFFIYLIQKGRIHLTPMDTKFRKVRISRNSNQQISRSTGKYCSIASAVLNSHSSEYYPQTENVELAFATLRKNSLVTFFSSTDNLHILHTQTSYIRTGQTSIASFQESDIEDHPSQKRNVNKEFFVSISFIFEISPIESMIVHPIQARKTTPRESVQSLLAFVSNTDTLWGLVKI